MMKLVSSKMWALVLGACALIGASCESTTKVGSECKDGVCPQANSVRKQTCLVSSLVANIEIVNDDENEVPGLAHVCLGSALPRDANGKVTCEVRWSLRAGSAEPPTSAPRRCSEATFLEPLEEDVDDVCVVAQLTAEEVGAGEDGWFYENSNDNCKSDDPAGIRFTDGARPPSGTRLVVTCSRAQTINEGKLVNVSVDECELTDSESVSDVGAACLPRAIPARGFDPRTASVEVRSDQCESEACLVFGLYGDPRPECVASETVQCPTAEEVERSIYCSCRCDAPEGDPGSLCECGEGFSCTPTIEGAPAGIRGSYCVRTETLLPQ